MKLLVRILDDIHIRGVDLVQLILALLDKHVAQLRRAHFREAVATGPVQVLGVDEEQRSAGAPLHTNHDGQFLRRAFSDDRSMLEAAEAHACRLPDVEARVGAALLQARDVAKGLPQHVAVILVWKGWWHLLPASRPFPGIPQHPGRGVVCAAPVVGTVGAHEFFLWVAAAWQPLSGLLEQIHQLALLHDGWWNLCSDCLQVHPQLLHPKL
mmetsp:Transcript_450/g.1363  ORF Transcript_450/g.1363 Transcript_450/m.1363 type:complete len:211 (-) Transcript_450:221-853(-)